MANFLDMIGLGKSEDPHVKPCMEARPKMIDDYLQRFPNLSQERKDFFTNLKKEDQRPYCDGSKQMGPLTDSSPVGLTQEQLDRLLKLPF